MYFRECILGFNIFFVLSPHIPAPLHLPSPIFLQASPNLDSYDLLVVRPESEKVFQVCIAFVSL